MRIRGGSLALVVTASVAIGLSSAEACSCVGSASLAAHARASELVFIGTVQTVDVPKPEKPVSTRGDGWASGGWPPGPATIGFHVDKILKGQPGAVVRFRGDGTNCDLTFAVGETWVVYASRAGDRLEAGKCSRTRLLRHARADLDYFDGLAQARAQGLVFGDVVRRGWDGAGQPALISPSRSAGLVVVARVDERRFAIDVDWSSFQLVLPVGAASVWVERWGRPVSAETAVSVKNGGEHRLVLVTEYDEP